MSQRIVPLTGTESERAANAAKVLNDELHTTRDQQRVFLQNKCVAPVFLGSVVDQTAMLALPSGSRGYFVGDICFREDKQCLYVGTADDGTNAASWLPIGAQRQAAVSDVDDSGKPVPGDVSTLTFSAVPTQAECEALRDAVASAVTALNTVDAAIIARVEGLRDRLRVTGGAGLISD